MTGVDLFTGLVAEGFHSALAPPTVLLLIVGLSMALIAREFAIPSICFFAFGVLLAAWARFGSRLGGANHFIVAFLLLVAGAALLWPPIRRVDWIAIVASFVAGAAVAGLWQPFVGQALASLLADLPLRGFTSLIPFGVYLFAALSPLFAIACIHHLAPDAMLEKIEPPLSILGAVVLATVAVAVAIDVQNSWIGAATALVS